MYGHVLPIRNTGTGQARSYAASVPGGLSRRESKVEAENEFATRPLRATEIDPRRHPRFKLGVDIIIHSRTCGVLKGHTVDISESGISAIIEDRSSPRRDRGVGLYAAIRSSDDLCNGSPEKRVSLWLPVP